MRAKIVAGNWKMNKDFNEAHDLLNAIVDYAKKRKDQPNEIVLCPPSIYLEMATDFAMDTNVFIGAQNINENASGAYTGEISAGMLQSMGVNASIIGHSERRKYFHESHETLAKKIDSCLQHDITPIFCIGELLEQRESGDHFEVVKQQLADSAFHLDEEGFSSIIIAYEPVWAIGTGKTASTEQAQEMHAYIRKLIAEKYGEEMAEHISILYGGSCNPGNAKELFSMPDVDGGLIGGASLKADDFIKIIEAH